MTSVTCRVAQREGSRERRQGPRDGPGIAMGPTPLRLLYLRERSLPKEPRGRAVERGNRTSTDVAVGKVWEGRRGNLIRIHQQHVLWRHPK